MNSLKSSATLALKILAVMFLTMIGVQGLSNDGPTDGECDTAWTSSSASSSCGEDTSVVSTRIEASVDTSNYNVYAHNNQCYVEVDCLRSDLTVLPTSNTFTGSSSDVKNLLNCDGELKVGMCSR